MMDGIEALDGLPALRSRDIAQPRNGRLWPRNLAEFERLVEDLQHPLVNFAYCRLQNRADAEDVVQDVLVSAYRHRERYLAVSDAGALLYRMVANRATDLLRQRRPAHDSSEEAIALVAAPDVTPEDGADAERRARAIATLLERLPARQAEVIRLRVYGGLAFDAIAGAIGTSVPTVKSRFRYGIQKLRKTLNRVGGGR